jgi:hypothetical protein
LPLARAPVLGFRAAPPDLLGFRRLSYWSVKALQEI